MTIASGVAKVVALKKESAWGVLAGAASGKQIRRVTSDLDLAKQTYESNEIRTDYQDSDARHGVRSIGGGINGELSPGSYQELLAAALRKDFVAGGATASASITIAAAGSLYTLTRGAGSYISDGHRVGHVIRLTAGAFVAGNLNKNLLIVALTATVATVLVLGGLSLTAEGPIAAAAVTSPGKVSYTPQSSHTDDSFTIEHWFPDVAQSERFTGCKVNTVDINLPPSGMATVRFTFMGKDMSSDTSQYFTAPTAPSTTGILAAVNGAVVVNGTPVALLTGLQFSINGGMSAEPVVGSNTYPDINEGRVRVNGQMTAFFQDATLRDMFVNETEASIVIALTTGNAATDDFMSFTLSRVKLGGAGKNDGERGIVQTLPFRGLVGRSGLSTEQTTLMIHDSQAA